MLGFAPIAAATLADPDASTSISVAVTGSAGTSAVGTTTAIPTINVPSTGTSANSGVGGVTATGNLASVNASNTFAANQTINGNLTISGTVDGVDIAAFKTSFDNLSTDIVNDSSPQLGAALDGQNNNLNNIGTIDGTNLQLDFGSIA